MPHAETIDSHFSAVDKRLFSIDKEIIKNVIMRDFVGEDVEGVRHSSINLLEEMEDGSFKIYIKNGKQFDFCTRLVESGQRLPISM